MLKGNYVVYFCKQKKSYSIFLKIYPGNKRFYNRMVYWFGCDQRPEYVVYKKRVNRVGKDRNYIE